MTPEIICIGPFLVNRKKDAELLVIRGVKSFMNVEAPFTKILRIKNLIMFKQSRSPIVDSFKDKEYTKVQSAYISRIRLVFTLRYLATNDSLLYSF